MQKLKTALEFSSKVRHFVQVCPIGEGPNLLGPNLPQHQKLCGAQLTAKSARGPICLEAVLPFSYLLTTATFRKGKSFCPISMFLQYFVLHGKSIATIIFFSFCYIFHFQVSILHSLLCNFHFLFFYHFSLSFSHTLLCNFHIYLITSHLHFHLAFLSYTNLCDFHISFITSHFHFYFHFVFLSHTLLCNFPPLFFYHFPLSLLLSFPIPILICPVFPPLEFPSIKRDGRFH